MFSYIKMVILIRKLNFFPLEQKSYTSGKNFRVKLGFNIQVLIIIKDQINFDLHAFSI